MRHWIWKGVLLVVAVDVLFLWWWSSRPKDSRYDYAIRQASDRYGIKESLIKAVIWKESRFEAQARGTSGEIGLMQIRELAAREWAEAESVSTFKFEHLFNPRTNVFAGTWYLRKLLDRYLHTDDALPYALADYNAGRTHVLRWNHDEGETNSRAFYKQITYPSTQNYIKSVMVRRRHYAGQRRKD